MVILILYADIYTHPIRGSNIDLSSYTVVNLEDMFIAPQVGSNLLANE